MSDINNDGHVDEFERNIHKTYLGRSFILVIGCLILLAVLGFFNKGESAYYPMVALVAAYCGRAVASDISEVIKKK